ncbi:hypothetical protein H2509_15085 [Stappia sp. F7233]|uniref:Uncharacterized protein n=1 Tax=Stappia albiluteola TaxID=2758565 RepID=A0A839AFG2_9HYPH|nr:hypothetical protein [Stappia albiluteola]MBA5778453.1 hypothetical protein [Stappia albiluteola]
MAIQNATFSLPPQLSYIKNLRAKFDDLQLQLGTGRKSQTYSGLGGGSSLDLILKQQRSQIAVYNQSISVADLRLKTLDLTSTRLEKIRIDAKAAIDQNNFNLFPNGRTQSQTSAEIQLRDFVAQLNTNVGGRYLFSGTALDRSPVAELDYLLQGDGNYAGLRQVTREYNEADLGADNKGRLVTASAVDTAPNPPVATVSIFEDAVKDAHPFGFKIYSVQSGLSNVTVNSGRQPAPTTLSTAAINPSNLGQTFTGGDLIVDGKTISIDDGSALNDVTLQTLADEISQKLAAAPSKDVTVTVDNGRLVFSKADGADLTIAGDLPLLNRLAIPVGGNGQAESTNGSSVAEGTQRIDFRFEGQPEPGEVIRLFLDLPDGTQTEIRIGAEGQTQEDPAYTFEIGDTAEETSANFKAALDEALIKVGQSELRAASSIRASENFFDNLPRAGGQPGGPFRVAEGAGTAGYYSFQFQNGGTTFAAVDQFTFEIAVDNGAPRIVTINQSDVVGAGGDATIDDINEFTAILASKLAGDGVSVTNDGENITLTSNSTGQASRVAISQLNTNADANGAGTVAAQTFGLADNGGTPGQAAAVDFAHATSIASSPNNTVAWYRGENGTDPARGTNLSRIDDNLHISYGARANEDAYREVIQSLAAFVAADFSTTQPENQGYHKALAIRARRGVTEPENSVSGIRQNHIEFATAYTALDGARERHVITNGTIALAVDGIEGVNRDEVAVKLLELQTLLEVTYRATSIAFDLTLSDFI